MLSVKNIQIAIKKIYLYGAKKQTHAQYSSLVRVPYQLRPLPLWVAQKIYSKNG